MNYINKKQTLVVLTSMVLICIGFSACTMKDELTVIPPKSLEEYKIQMTEFLDKEKMTVDSAKVGYNKNNFKTKTDSTTNKGIYLAAIEAAKAIVSKADVKIAEIATADKSLSTAGKAFWAALWLSDRRELNDSIMAATALNNSIIAGSLAGQVLNDAKTAFSTAISKATSTRGATLSVDMQIKTAISLLSDAKKTFQAAVIPATIEAFVANSKSYITAQKTLVESSVAGYGKGEYPALTRTNYLNVLIAANDIVNKAGVTYEELSAAMNALLLPRTAYLPFIADHRSLNDTIIIAEALSATIVVGTAKGQAVTVAKTALTTAITAAKTSRETVTLTEGATNAARYKMGLAIKTLSASIVLGDLIIDSETLKAATTIGTGIGQVNQIANSVFTLAISDVKKIRDTGTSTYAQMMAAIVKLTEAKNTFQSAIVK
jgi:hypothetical protein